MPNADGATCCDAHPLHQALGELFGYGKGELEGVNVSVLMPQPFSQRHPSYLQRYTSTGSPHILDSVREVVALHKDRFAFPIRLCVTKLSGSGSDCVFLGLIRRLPASLSVRLWVGPGGRILCADESVANLTGCPSESLVGTNFAELVTDPSAATALLDR